MPGGLPGDDLTGQSFENEDLTNANFNAAICQNAIFTDQDLYRGYLVGATLRGRTCSGATLTNVDFTGATLTGATLLGADLHRHSHGCCPPNPRERRLPSTASSNWLCLQGHLWGDGANYAGHNFQQTQFHSNTAETFPLTNVNYPCRRRIFC